MPLATGTRLGAYEIIAPLGAGGMGEVYRARDPRLGRDVAIKLIPDVFAQDAERLARFEREARLLASLQHANIAVLHGLEESGGRRFLVMECVEGESLAQRLGRGPLPLAETLEIGRAVAAALEAAHEGGIVHRDLKPGNIMVTPAGDVKVLDFGLAKGGASGGSSDPNMSASPTMTNAGTQAGVILGTAAYMSPEQARGKAVDRRTDIWSFGCVLYECLTGRKAFAGETISDIVACILQVEPAWAALPADTPERVRALLRRCLEKDAKRRLRDIGEARIEIEDLLAAGRSGVAAAAPATQAPARGGASPPWALITITAAVAAAVAAFAPQLLVRAPLPSAVRFEVPAPKGRTLNLEATGVSLSPDGRMLAMIAFDSTGTGSIWIRRLDTLVPRQLPGTEGVRTMFWSPDGRYLAFFVNDERLSKIAIDGGAAEKICDTKAARGGDWNRDGVIVLAPFSNGGLYRVSADGGPLVQLTHPDSAHGVTGHRFPLFLPDGKHFLFVSVPAGADGKGGLCEGSLDGGPTHEIARVEGGVTYVEPGWLLTVRGGTLVARPFDSRTRRVRGEPVVIGDPLVGTQFTGASAVSASRTGSLAFLINVDVPNRLVWLDPSGRAAGAPPVPTGSYFHVRLSPDGRRAALSVLSEPTRADLVLVDLERGARTRLTQAPDNPTLVEWSPDGTHLAFLDDNTQTISTLSLADGSRREYLKNDGAYKRLDQWTPDGKSLLIERLDAASRWDLWLLPVEGGPPTPCLRTPANEQAGAISPDGRWLAYTSDESGVVDEYVKPLVGDGLRYQVTIGGGAGGWSRDGKRFLFGYVREPRLIHSAAVQPGAEFSLGPPSVTGQLPQDGQDFDQSWDDKRWIVLVPAEKAPPITATILQNWKSAIRKH